MDKRRYWDSCVFLGWLKNEPDKVDKCRGVVKAAEEGDIIIVTSALTLTEVIHLKGYEKLPQRAETKIRKFFESDFIAVRTVDRIIAEEARQLVWKHGVKPKDSIHLATALKLTMRIVDTFDPDLLKLDGKLGDPVLRIGRPDVSYQEVMDFGKTEEAEPESEESDP